ncbi:class I adenylate-forming enzyme family protein [Microbispora sp. NPDC046973]|uniref:class I adenylate-forming enzyme family protein n=1 Tax=Microbispora sp. NPDC046973 TaxID=3155022 RepID=UPI0033D49BF4
MTISISHETVLTPEQRARFAADPDLGGGNLLTKAIEANPHPELPFIHLGRPLTNTKGEKQTEFSLLDLDELAQSWSVWYLRQGVRPRDRVAIYLEDSFAYSLHFYALAQIGAVAVLVNSKASRYIATELCRQTNPVGMYTDLAHLEILGEEFHLLPGLRWTQVAEELPAPPPAVLPQEARFRHVGEDPVSILHSSGTTGRPKPVIQTHRSCVAGPRFRLVDHHEQPGAVMMTALPQSHLGCIAYTTYAVLGGTPIVPWFDTSGPELAKAVEKYRPTTVMAFGHAYAELAGADLPAGAIDSVNVWISIGDAVHEKHIKGILAMRDPSLPPAAFFDRLGTTELGWGVLLKVRTLADERNDRCVGKPVGVAEVAVLRRDGTIADVNEVGLLGAKGPAITAGYWSDSDTTYRSKLSGYWLTGDMAYRDEAGNYFQVDRAVDAIETPTGTGYSVFMEELLLNDLPEVLDCAVVAGIHRGRTVPVAVVTSSAARPDAQKLLNEANERLKAAGHPELTMLEVARNEEDFPVGVTGKVLKRRLREKYSSLSTYIRENSGRQLGTILTDVFV